MDTATKTGIDAAKTTFERAVQKTSEATGDLIRNKIADEITSVGKSKNKQKENVKKNETSKRVKKEETSEEVEEIYIPPEKRQQIINELRLS